MRSNAIAGTAFWPYSYILLTNPNCDSAFAQYGCRSDAFAGFFYLEPGCATALVDLLCAALPALAQTLSCLAVDAIEDIWSEARAYVPFLSQVADMGTLESDL